jgi:hypothetical protein
VLGGAWIVFGLAWSGVSTTLPNGMISDLVFHYRDRGLTAATYGRCVWRGWRVIL